MTASEDGRGRNVRARVASPEPDLRVNEDPGDPDASRTLLDALSALREHATWSEVVQAATPFMPPNVHGNAFRNQLLLLVHPDRNPQDAERANDVTARVNSARGQAPATPAEVGWDLPCSMRVADAAAVISNLREATQQARNAVYSSGDEAFAARSQRDSPSSDLVVLLYDISGDSWTTETDVTDLDGAGLVFFSRVQVLFARCHPDGKGWNESGHESATFCYLKSNVLKPIARCYGADGVTTVGFLVTNAIPTMAYAAPEVMSRVSELHSAFDLQIDGSTLGDFSREQATETVRGHFSAMSLAVDESRVDVDVVFDIHSRKVSALLSQEFIAAENLPIGTSGSHPCAGIRRASDVPLFVALADVVHANPIFADLTRTKLYSDVINLNSVSASLQASRASYASSLRHTASSLPVKNLTDSNADASSTSHLFRHQKLAVEGIIENFVGGLPGSLLHLDVGFGKTTVMFATTYVVLRTGAVAGVTWLVEAFSMRDDRDDVARGEERVPAVLVAFREFLDGVPGLSTAAANELISKVHVLKTGHQGGTAEAMCGALQKAASANAGDHVVFVDEASRYVGTLRERSALVRLCESITGRVFRIAMTATPLTSALDRIYNVFAVLGASCATEGDRECARVTSYDCGLAVVAEIQGLNAKEPGAADAAAEVPPALADLTEQLRKVTVGHAAFANDDQVKSETERMVAAIGIRRVVLVVDADAPEEDLALCDEMVHALSHKSSAHLVRAKHELHPGLAVSAHAPGDAYAEYVVRVPQNRISPLARAICDTIANARANGRSVLVFFPSDLASVMHMVHHEVRSCTEGCERIAFVDGDTLENDRARFFEEINVRRDAVVVPDLDVLFMTIETSGYGLNATNVHTLVCVGFPWTDSALSQAMGRVTRACATNNGNEDGKLLIHVLPLSSRVGYNLRRLYRCAARGQSFGAFFPAIVHADRPALELRHVFEHPPQNEVQREAYREACGSALYSRIFPSADDPEEGEEDHPEEGDASQEPWTGRASVELSYDDFMSHVNAVIASIDGTTWGKTDLSFLISSQFGADDNEISRREHDGLGRGGRGPGRGPGRGRGRGRGRGGGGTYVPPTPVMRKEAVLAFCRRTSAKVPALPDATRASARNTAERLATSLAEAYEAAESEEYTARNAHDHDYWITFDTSSPLRRQLVFASAWAKVSFQYSKSYFALANPPQRADDEQERVQYGVDHEADAVEHVKRKYAFELIEPDHVKKFTRLHPTMPRVLAGSADAITQCGVLLEIKCIKSKDAFFNKIANVGRKALDDYVDQVRALLEVYNLPLGLLCYWHKDDDGPALSFEFPVYRDESWWRAASAKMVWSINKQRERLQFARAWQEEIMCPE